MAGSVLILTAANGHEKPTKTLDLDTKIGNQNIQTYQPERFEMRTFYEALADLKYEMEIDGDRFEDFSPYVDPETDPTLNYLFEMSGLSSAKPGHWQALARVLSNLISAGKRPAKKRWTPEFSMLLLDEAYKIRKRAPHLSLGEICAELGANGMPFENDGIKTTLSFRFQEAIRPIRKLVKSGKASRRQIEIVTAFENFRRSPAKKRTEPRL